MAIVRFEPFRDLLGLQARMNRMPHVHRDPSWPEKAVRRLFGTE